MYRSIDPFNESMTQKSLPFLRVFVSMRNHYKFVYISGFFSEDAFESEVAPQGGGNDCSRLLTISRSIAQEVSRQRPRRVRSTVLIVCSTMLIVSSTVRRRVQILAGLLTPLMKNKFRQSLEHDAERHAHTMRSRDSENSLQNMQWRQHLQA